MAFAAMCGEFMGLEEGIASAYRQKGMYAETSDYLLNMKDAEKYLKELEVPSEWVK